MRICTFWCMLLLSLVQTGTAAAVTVYAAASLKETLDAASAAFTRATGVETRLVYAGSAALARQIEQGAPADLVLTADEEWMGWLEKRQLLQPGSRRALLGNRLVVIAPIAGNTDGLLLADAESWLELLGERPLALAEVESVPAGRYARAALQQLGVWSRLQSRVVMADNVRAAMLFVVHAEAALGLVYATDARAERRVRVVAELPDGLHPPIIYPLALLRGGAAQAVQFHEFLLSPAAAEVFREHGFTVLTP